MSAPASVPVYTQGFGTASTNPSITSTVAPGSTNIQGPNGTFNIGQRWINTSNNTEYVLTSFSVSNGALTANWQVIASSSGGVLAVSQGGTGAATFTAHGVLVGEGTSPIVATAVGSTGQVLIGASGADPAFGALGVNSGLTAHGVLLGENNSAIAASAAGTSGQVFTSGGAAADGAYQNIGTNSGLTAHGVLLAENNSAFAATAVGATGTVLAGVTGADPTFQAIPALNVVDVTGTSQALAVNTTYIADNAGLVTLTLPATAAQGTQIAIVGNGAGGWTIAQNANQVIKMNANTTTTGATGSMSSTNRFNCVTIFATVGGASTTWVVNNFSGTFSFV